MQYGGYGFTARLASSTALLHEGRDDSLRSFNQIPLASRGELPTACPRRLLARDITPWESTMGGHRFPCQQAPSRR